VWQGTLRAASSGAVVRLLFGILPSKIPMIILDDLKCWDLKLLTLAAGQGFMRNPRGEKAMSGIRIYVACLASYNNGELHGQWIDAAQGQDGIWEDVKAMLAASPTDNAEEWVIHDYDGFEGASISEYEGFESVAEKAEFIEEHQGLGGKLLEYYSTIEDARNAIDDHYYGLYESVSEFAQQLTEETTTIPENLSFYIDYEKMGRELEINDIFTIETAHNEVHVFWSH
jgi:antirestriction protein